MRRLIASIAICALLAGPAAPLVAQPAPGTAGFDPANPPTETRVGLGETLFDIAERTRSPLQGLIETNKLDPPYALSPGQVLILPPLKVHVVKRGDNFSAIARRYSVDERSLAVFNRLPRPVQVQPGQKIILPPMVKDRLSGLEPQDLVDLLAAELSAGRAISGRANGPIKSAATDTVTPVTPSQEPPAQADPGPMPVFTVPPTPQPPTPQAPVPKAPTPKAPTPKVPAPKVQAPKAPVPKATSTAQTPSANAPSANAPAVKGPAPKTVPAQAPTAKAPKAPTSKSAAVRPVPDSVTQPPFVANLPDVATAGFFNWPIVGQILETFGPKRDLRTVDGIEIAAPEGTPFKAAADGTVAYVGNQLPGYGWLVLVRHAEGFMTAYAYASGVNVREGQKVTRGQTIGQVGQTGRAQTPRLHFQVRRGVRPVDPMRHLPTLRR